ncbi:hypothetical protein GWI33_016117 [Rhynchophorus ferrugineus]|uniref:Uncharacterized protein n=1 Tax=Rhynchophorus ferrugineus TaxID=354439 RepID=A0A834I0S0_RHYFE|nr:hypothetical protein GWI33_016117 [Rhynchophorus ferrugineus]
MTLEQFEVDERGPILSKTPPDVCTTNRCQDFATSSELSSAGTLEINYCSSGATCTTHNQQAGGLAGQTIPITIKNRNFVSPLAFSGVPASKYGTLPGTTLHQGFLGVSDLGSSSSNSSSGYCGKSKTLQHPKTKKVHKPESFFVPDANFDGFGKQRTNSALNYSGSAV